MPDSLGELLAAHQTERDRLAGCAIRAELALSHLLRAVEGIDLPGEAEAAIRRARQVLADGHLPTVGPVRAHLDALALGDDPAPAT